MRNLLGRLRRSGSRSLVEQLATLTSVGDGSTLNLDFTTGVLDPRLSFSRLGDATFINSSGLVQFANANLMTYSNPRQTGTAWGTTGTVTWGSSTLTDPTGGSAAQSITFGTTGSAIFNTSGTTVVSGITHTFSVWMRSATGTTTVRIGDANVAPVATVTLTTTWQRFSCQYTTSGTNDGGAIYSQTGTPSAEFYVWGAQVQPGSIVGELLQTSGTINNNIPRFDHDPTTLAPRGLLIEGAATNLARRSDDFNTTVTDGTQWVAAGYTAGTLSTTLPDGTTGNARRISTASGSGSFRSADITVTASTAYTFSFWARNNGGSQARFRVWNVTAGSSIVDYTQSINNYVSQIGGANNTSSTWVRVSVQFTTPAGCTAIYVYPTSSDSGTVDLLIWGAQVETGSGASSYIPTGASTATRALESCVMTGTNFSSWFAGATEGVLYAECERPRKIESPAADHAIVGTRYSSGQGLWVYASATNQYPSSYIFPSGGAQFAGGIATMIPLVSKQAVRWFNANDITNFGNGIQGTTNTAGTGTMVPTMLTIGANSTTGTAANLEWLNGCVRRVKFWPVALPDSQIIALTTP
jgi:hypothetical protein